MLFLVIHACVFSKQAVGKPFPHLVLPNISRVSLPAQITLHRGTEGSIVTGPVIDEPRVTADLCPEGRAEKDLAMSEDLLLMLFSKKQNKQIPLECLTSYTIVLLGKKHF